jgi:hypothetical protein
MKLLSSNTLAALAAMFVIPTFAHSAAVVTYSNYTASNSADTSWMVNPIGSSVVANFNVGGSQTTFGGETWLSTIEGGATANEATSIDFYFSVPGSWAPKASVFYSGGPALLNDGAYWSFNANALLELKGFTLGQDYLVQFVFADTRYNGGQMQVQAISGVSGNSTSTTYSSTAGQYLVVNAQFKADTVNTAWKPVVDGGSGEQLNAIRILTIPEPSAALLGGFGLLALLRRRR